MEPLSEFDAIIRREEPLAPFTLFKLGGPAQMLVTPRSQEELSRVVRCCSEAGIPLRVLGSGCNMLVRDEGVRGAVLRLSEPAFTSVGVNGDRARAGTGAAVSALIAEAARHNLAGLETLVGIPGTVGGALRTNAGDRAGDIGQFVRQVEVMDGTGAVQVRERLELVFGDHASNLDDPVLLSAEFALQPDKPEAIVKRMRRAWITRKAMSTAVPQSAGRIFKNPRGLGASDLLEKAGLAKEKVGGAEVSDRDPNWIVVHPGATARDVLRLISLMRERVSAAFNVDLEPEIAVW
ncbi:MAG: UDP-N-acetylmuramate dehydrogenase [Gemmataceae bacterium]|nr:UDP-N-acetylmuramate dehydrogenase [Gemmataceae bacterium]